MSDKNHRASQVTPGPLCLRVAPLLPILDEEELDAEEVAEARAHLATCDYCQAQRAIYRRLDKLVARHFAPGAEQLKPVIGADLVGDVSYWPDTESAAELDDFTVETMPTASQQRPRRILGLGALAAVLVVSLMAGALFASHQQIGPNGGRTAATATTAPLTPGSQTILTAVSMVSPSDGWAVGTYLSSRKSLLMHFTDGKWVPVATSVPAALTDIKMISATDGWAAGGNGLAHFDGRTWTTVHTPVASAFFAISVVSAENIWVVGASVPGKPGQPTILHYDGAGWVLAATPRVGNAFELLAISMTSADEGWAVGQATYTGVNSTVQGVILHYTGGSWRVAETLPNISLDSVAMSSPYGGWILGDSIPNQEVGVSEEAAVATKAWRYRNGAWVEAQPPAPTHRLALGSMVRIGPDGMVWAVTTEDSVNTSHGNQTVSNSIINRYISNNWTQITMPELKDRSSLSIREIAFLSPTEFWAVGSASWWTGIGDPAGPRAITPTITPLILHYKDGNWTVVAS